MPNRSWFIIDLNRLAELCKDEQEKQENPYIVMFDEYGNLKVLSGSTYPF